jgi:hypothetical protein
MACPAPPASCPTAPLGPSACPAASVRPPTAKTLQDLGIPIQRRERPIQYVVQVLQPHLELALRIDALDVYLNLARVDVNPGHHLEQVGELGPKGQVRLQLLDVNVDLIDLHLRDIDKDVGIMARLAPLKL